MKKVSSTSERLRQYMAERGMNQKALIDLVAPYSEELGVKFNSAYLSQVLKKKFEPTQEKIYLLSKALHVSTNWLMGQDEEETQLPPNAIPLRTVPVLGTIACGTPIEAIQSYDEDIPLPDGIRADFALRCSGDSMAPSIKSGDYVFIRSQPDVDDGQVAAVVIDGEATLKKVYHIADGLLLIAENTNFPAIRAEKTEIIINGLAVGVFHSLI